MNHEIADYKTTARVVGEQLKENTGSHFLDSGGFYGRYWQFNQGRKFRKEPQTVLKFDVDRGGIAIRHNLYHWLVARLDFAPGLQEMYEKSRDQRNTHIVNMEDFAVSLVESYGATGLYGEGLPDSVNTYNRMDLLTQVIQYAYFTVEGCFYVLLQVHGGCDVRGGYTPPKAYRVKEDGYPMFQNSEATVRCEAGHYWWTDDAHNLYFRGCSAEKHLEAYDLSGDKRDRGKSRIFVDTSGRGFCPLCGSRLTAYFDSI